MCRERNVNTSQYPGKRTPLTIAPKDGWNDAMLNDYFGFVSRRTRERAHKKVYKIANPQREKKYGFKVYLNCESLRFFSFVVQ